MTRGRKPANLGSMDKLDLAANELHEHILWKLGTILGEDGVKIRSLNSWGLTRGWRRDYMTELLIRLEERGLVRIDEKGELITEALKRSINNE